MDKLFLIKLWFEKEIHAESEEKATEIFYTKFNETKLADLDLQVNYQDKIVSQDRTQYEIDLNYMISYYMEKDYIHKVDNERKSVIQMFDEKIEIMICGKCMQEGKFYSDHSGMVACKHHLDEFFEQYREMKENGTL